MFSVLNKFQENVKKRDKKNLLQREAKVVTK